MGRAQKVAKAPEDPCNLLFESATFRGSRTRRVLLAGAPLRRGLISRCKQGGKKNGQKTNPPTSSTRHACPSDSVKPPINSKASAANPRCPVLQRSSYYSLQL